MENQTVDRPLEWRRKQKMRTFINRYLAIGLLMLVPLWAGAVTIDLQASLDGDQANAGAGTGSLGTALRT